MKERGNSYALKLPLTHPSPSRGEDKVEGKKGNSYASS